MSPIYVIPTHDVVIRSSPECCMLMGIDGMDGMVMEYDCDGNELWMEWCVGMTSSIMISSSARNVFCNLRYSRNGAGLVLGIVADAIFEIGIEWVIGCGIRVDGSPRRNELQCRRLIASAKAQSDGSESIVGAADKSEVESFSEQIGSAEMHPLQ